MKSRRKNLRLYFVGISFVLVTLVLWGRLIQIQVISGEHYKEIAKTQWKVTREVPPVRGGIFDRAGRPLALSIRTCSVSIRPQEIKNRNKIASVLSRETGVSRSAIRKKLRSKKSFVWIKRQCTLSEKAQNELRSLAGVEIHLEADRIYPYGKIANKIVGFIGHDNRGMAGIEASFDESLQGVAGWEEVQRDGAYRSRGYHTYAQKRPINGQHVILTIDASLQEIAELELERAIQRTGAKSGTLIVLDCQSGEILSLAELPSPNSTSHSDSLWTIRSVSYVYEPGSTFKLVTAAALLETSKVRSFDVFDGEKGRATIRSAVISDSHPYGHLTFREAFVYSSNIVMAKASLFMEPLEFFKYIRLFGFGSKTGIRLLGESTGRVAPTEEWSDRSQLTMAFGQEIAVTPLQMANAYAAIANNGTMMVPRIVRSVVDEKSGDVQNFEPVRIRNVVSKDTARRLRGFCRSVVEEGTGTQAQLDFLEISGKTGTAEKASVRGGYMRDKFVASFVGFVPHRDPKIVCLVMLDEPNYNNRFGGVSAAPVFARISEAIANSSHVFDSVLSSDVIEGTSVASKSFKAPNFLRLTREVSMENARKLGLNVMCTGEGEVVAQKPDPGVAMEKDEVVRLFLAKTKTAKNKTPDLRGLPVRLAKRLAVEAGLKCRIEGSGIVVSQTPKPGRVAKSGVVMIRCKANHSKRRAG